MWFTIVLTTADETALCNFRRQMLKCYHSRDSNIGGTRVKQTPLNWRQDQASLAKNFKQYLIKCEARLRVEGGHFQQPL